MAKFSCKIKKLLVLGADPSFFSKKKRVYSYKKGVWINYSVDGHGVWTGKKWRRILATESQTMVSRK